MPHAGSCAPRCSCLFQQPALKAGSRKTWSKCMTDAEELTGNWSLRLCWWLDIGSCCRGWDRLRGRLNWRRWPGSRRHTERRHRALLRRHCWGDLWGQRHCSSSWRHHRRRHRHDRRRGWGNLCSSGRHYRLLRWHRGSCRRHLLSCGRHRSSGRLCGDRDCCCRLPLHRHWRNSTWLRRLHWGNRVLLRIHRHGRNNTWLRRQDWGRSRCNRREHGCSVHWPGCHGRC